MRISWNIKVKVLHQSLQQSFERFNKSKKWNMILCNHLFKKAKICQRAECVLQLCIMINHSYYTLQHQKSNVIMKVCKIQDSFIKKSNSNNMTMLIVIIIIKTNNNSIKRQ